MKVRILCWKMKMEIWEVEVKNNAGLEHLSLVKVRVTSANGKHDRIPAYIKYATQNEIDYDFTGRLWSPEKNIQVD